MISESHRGVCIKLFIFAIYLVPSFCANVSIIPGLEALVGQSRMTQIPSIVLDKADVAPGGSNMSILNHAMYNPYFFGLWGTDWTRKCFRNRRILFLGDSTMAETLDDLALLLSGIGTNRTKMEEYLFQSSLSSHVHPTYKRIDLPRNITVEYYGGRRNLTVTSRELNMDLRFRFTGHHRLFHNFEGILSFFHKDFAAELECLLGRRSGSDCTKPTIIVINSGLHDARGHNNATTYAFHLEKLFEHLMNTSLPKPRVIWKANILSPEPQNTLPRPSSGHASENT